MKITRKGSTHKSYLSIVLLFSLSPLGWLNSLLMMEVKISNYAIILGNLHKQIVLWGTVI